MREQILFEGGKMPHWDFYLDMCADTCVVYKPENTEPVVLLRKHDKYKIWLLPGGHVDPGETPDEAAIREVKEETGLDVFLFPPPITVENGRGAELVTPQHVNVHNITKEHEHCSFIFYALAVSPNFGQGNGQEISEEMRWFSEAELQDPKWDITPNIAAYALAALELSKEYKIEA